ncbi:hypothetical protein M0802_009754 [Mischocyttarus mexicanus]|nr:hypothetical protein M0802_009754 [Mischocyttarus mexicanus]
MEAVPIVVVLGGGRRWLCSGRGGCAEKSIDDASRWCWCTGGGSSDSNGGGDGGGGSGGGGGGGGGNVGSVGGGWCWWWWWNAIEFGRWCSQRRDRHLKRRTRLFSFFVNGAD